MTWYKLGRCLKVTLKKSAPKNFAHVEGAERRVSRAQTGERGPPSAVAEIGPSVLRATSGLAEQLRETRVCHFATYVLNLFSKFLIWLPGI